MDKKILISEKTEEILDFIKLSRKPKTVSDELEKILSAYKYVIQNIHINPYYKEPDAKDRREFYVNALCAGLTNNPGLPTTNSILLKHLLDMAGVENYLVASRSNSSNQNHVSNLVRIGSEFYFFDSTLEKAIMDDQTDRPEDLFMICAGLGRTEYGKFYTPISILGDLSQEPSDKLPENISDESMAKTIINGINYRIPSLVRNEPQTRGEEIEFN